MTLNLNAKLKVSLGDNQKL